MSNCFYFVIRTRSGGVTVVDLDHCVDYEREDWRTFDQRNFYKLVDAIAHARNLASYYKLVYEPFESRYDSSLNEI